MSVIPYPTSHIAARPEDFAKTVLMPGDPLRSQFIAENFLSETRLINNIRGVQGYTGKYCGVPVTVMASGMGIPSIGIYSYELFNFFGIDNIIRVGSAGSINNSVFVRDIVIGMGACTDSNYALQFKLPGTFAPICDYGILTKAVGAAEKNGARYHVGNLLSTDAFYSDDETAVEKWAKMGVLAIEMETAGLYMNASRSGKNALAICTVSNHILTGEETTAYERQNSFTQMIEISLDTAASLSKASAEERL